MGVEGRYLYFVLIYESETPEIFFIWKFDIVVFEIE